MSRGPRQALIPSLPRPAWVVLGGDFLSAIGTGLTLPCLIIYAHQVRHLSYPMAGLVLSAIALASLLGNPLGGAAADRWTPRRALMGGLAIAAAGSVALAAAVTAAELFAAAALLGLGVSVIWPVQDALLAHLAGSERLSSVFSVRHATMNAGLGLGALGTAAVVSVAHPVTFTWVYLADAASFLAFVPVLARLRIPAGQSHPEPADTGERLGFRMVLRDRVFLRVWALTALLVIVSFGQYQSSFAGYATRPGGISTHALALAYAANTITVVAAQLFVLRWLGGRRRTTGAALAAAAWGACWIAVIAGGRLGGSAAAAAVFAAAMVIFGLAETLLSPTLSAIINDLAPPGAAGRYNGLGVLAYTTGFLIGPAAAGLALGAGSGTTLYVALVGACAVAAAAALRLGRHVPPAANHIEAETAISEPAPEPAPASLA